MYPMDSYRNRVPMLQFPIKLDVGAGAYPKEGFVRLDFDPCNGATDIVWDIKSGIPLPDGCVSELFTSHFLEHLMPTDLHYVLQEMWRVCANGAQVTIKVPHGETSAGRLPCHYAYWNEAAMHAINDWFPHAGHPDYNGNYWEVQKVWTEEPYHLLGSFLIVKGKPL
jgi:predicted SAM-dependent methyltransferase